MSQTRFRGSWMVFGLAAATLFAGCYERTEKGGVATYQFAWWVGVLVIVGGLVGMPLGFILRRFINRLGWALMIASPVLLILIAPAMYSDYVHVSRDQVEARYGAWFAPNIRKVRFDDVQQIHIVAKRDAKNRISHEMQCVMKAGGVETIAMGDLVRNAVPEILNIAQDRNIPVLKTGDN